MIREVGEAPFQYGEPDWDGEEWDEDAEEDEDDLPGILPQDVIQSLFKTLPIPMETVVHIHKYFEAGARLYGVIPVMKLLELYGRAVILKNNKPKYLLINLEQEMLIHDLTDEEKLEIASKRILNQYKPAFEELSKN